MISSALSSTRDTGLGSFSMFPDEAQGITIKSPNSSVFHRVPTNNLIVKYRDKITSFPDVEFRSDTIILEKKDTIANIECDAIKKHFILLNGQELNDYLKNNYFLYAVLFNAAKVIADKFGSKVKSTLELYTFHDGGNKSIFLTLHCDDSIVLSSDAEDEIVEAITCYSAKPLNGRLAISFA